MVSCGRGEESDPPGMPQNAAGSRGVDRARELRLRDRALKGAANSGGRAIGGMAEERASGHAAECRRIGRPHPQPLSRGERGAERTIRHAAVCRRIAWGGRERRDQQGGHGGHGVKRSTRHAAICRRIGKREHAAHVICAAHHGQRAIRHAAICRRIVWGGQERRDQQGGHGGREGRTAEKRVSGQEEHGGCAFRRVRRGGPRTGGQRRRSSIEHGFVRRKGYGWGAAQVVASDGGKWAEGGCRSLILRGAADRASGALLRSAAEPVDPLAGPRPVCWR
jgi:hypothetical protein